MRVREKRPARGDIIDVPPRELRQFDPHEYPGADGSVAGGWGAEVFGSRGAWLEARQAWAEANGMTVHEWWERLADAAAVHAYTLGELNSVFSDEYLCEPDEDDDPRLDLAV